MIKYYIFSLNNYHKFVIQLQAISQQPSIRSKKTFCYEYIKKNQTGSIR